MEALDKYSKTLYKLGSLNRVKEWSIRVFSDPKGRVYEETMSGYLGGRLKVSSKPSPGDASKKAETKAEKKRREGYVDSVDEAKKASVTLSGMQAKFMTLEEVSKLPMRKLVDEKFNGVRGTYYYDTDIILSKGNKEWNVGHIHKQLNAFSEASGLHIVDFEFYAPGYKVNEISSMVKSPSNPNRLKLKAYIFDALEAVDDVTPALKRKIRLDQMLSLYGEAFEYLIRVPYYFIKDVYQLPTIYDQIIANGGEGIIVRDADEPYEFDNKSRRSTKMIKVKPLYTKEFLCVGCSFEKRKVRGEWMDLIIYTCETPNGKTFDVTPEGDVESRCVSAPDFNEELWYIVEFREYTTNGIPFHGVGKGFRDAEDIDYTSSDWPEDREIPEDDPNAWPEEYTK